jgi:hypothetical protein
MRQELGKSADGDIARGNGHDASRHGVADEQEKAKYSTGLADETKECILRLFSWMAEDSGGGG